MNTKQKTKPNAELTQVITNVTMKPNTELAYRVLDIIKQNEDHFVMRYFVGTNECGTVMCLAGWTAVQAGCTVRDGMFYKPENGRLGPPVSPSGVAAEALNISLDDASYLFYGDYHHVHGEPPLELWERNSIPGLEVTIKEVFGARPT